MKQNKKQIREEAEKAALRRRILDMAFGAFGYYVGAEDIDPASVEHTGMFSVLSPDALSRWMGAVAIHLIGQQRDGVPHTYLKPHSLADWDDLNGLVEKLYLHGVRA